MKVCASVVQIKIFVKITTFSKMCTRNSLWILTRRARLVRITLCKIRKSRYDVILTRYRRLPKSILYKYVGNLEMEHQYSIHCSGKQYMFNLLMPMLIDFERIFLALFFIKFENTLNIFYTSRLIICGIKW